MTSAPLSLLAFGLLAGAPPVTAPPTSLPVPPAEAPVDPADASGEEPTSKGPGVVRLFVFGPDGAPLPGVVVRAADREATSDDLGEVALPLLDGTWELVLVAPHSEPVTIPGVLVGEGLETEVLVTLKAQGAPVVDIEAPPAALTRSGQAAAAPAARAVADRKGPPGVVKGRLAALEGGDAVAGARVLVRGTDLEVVTDDEGRFELSLPEGEWALSVVHPRYSAAVQEGVTVKAGETTELALELTPAALELEAFTVSAPHIAGSVAAALDQRRKSESITEVLGAADMARTGDSDAAGALSRVTGITVVGGRYVYVRGLGERYSSTLLNGAGLPSPEPERRVVPLDLFPTSVLENITIRKTYMPDLPGEFGGGTVELKTRSFPDEGLLLKLGVSGGGNTQSTFRQGLTYRGGLLDPIGIDDGTRALPAEIRDASAEQSLQERDRFSDRGYTAAELERFGESFSKVWNLSRMLVPPDLGASAEVGYSMRLFEKLKVGFLAGLTSGSDWERLQYHQDYLLVGANNQLERGHSYNFELLENRVRLGSVFTFGFQWGEEHTVTSTTLLGRVTTNEARTYQGYNRDVSTDIRVDRLRWVERMLLVEQLAGVHKFPFLWDFQVDWRYTYALATRYEPDRREVRYDRETGDEDVWILSDRPEGNQRFFSNLLDHNHDAGLTLKLPFKQWNGLEASVSGGLAANFKTRGVETRRYKFLHKGPLSGDSDVITRDPESIFTPENISSEGFQLGEITRQTDNYDANQLVLGSFVMGDLPLWHGIRAAGGVRVEYFRQFVRTFELFNPDNEPVVAELNTLDVLPAANLALDLGAADWMPDWSVFDGMQLRSGFSLTVSRPDFRELSPATFNDVTGGRQTFGNPELQRALIFASDLRWEYYPTKGTSLSVAGFYKHFWNPIEQVVIVSAQHSITYANALAADNVGAEIELRSDFGWVHPWLEGAYAAGNAALIYSQVALDEDAGIQTSSIRPLQGQSPWVLNGQVGYDNPDRGVRLALLYNVFGPRISSVGALGVPDMYEQPFHRFDVVYRQDLGWGVALGFKGENLLDLPATWTQGDHVIGSIKKGRSLSASLSWSW